MSLSDSVRREQVREQLFKARIETMILAEIQVHIDNDQLARELAESIMDKVYTPISARWYGRGIHDCSEEAGVGGR